MRRIHWAWLLMFGLIPLPASPVPGNSDGAGTWMSEYQYPAGKYCAAARGSGAATAWRFSSVPGVAGTLGESTRPYPRTHTVYLALGRSGMRYRPRSSVTTILA